MKISNIIKKVPFMGMFVPTKVNMQTGVIDFGKDNLLPNKLMAWVLESGAAKKAQQKRSIYIAADGFTDENAAKFKVNDKQTADQLLSEISGYVSYFDGFALHVKRDGNFKIVSIKCLPFQDIRKKEDGNFTYNPTLSCAKFEKNKAIDIPAFKGVRSITAEEFMEIKEVGEIYYAYTPTADNPHYPVPDYYAGIEDIRSSSELQKFDYETVLNGFVPSAILTLIGDLDTDNKDSRGMTEYDYFTENLEQFTGHGKNSEGVSGRNKLMVVTARNKDEAPVVTPFDAKAIFESSNSKRDLIERAVCRLFGVNPVLVGYADAQILGNQQALANASNELNNDVLGDQSLISLAFTTLFPTFDWTISSFKPIQYVPTELLSTLKPNEKRALIGYAPNDNESLSDKIGEEKTKSVLDVLGGSLSDSQKRASLKILFGLSDTDILALVPNNDVAPADTTNIEQVVNFFENNYYEFKAAKITREDINQRYNDYYDCVNMTYSELEKWSDTECSKLSGLNRASIARNLELLNINKADWTEKHYRWAGQTIAFINRVKENANVGEPIQDSNGKTCGTKTFISLKNWGYNPNKE